APYAFATPFLQRFTAAPLVPRDASLDIRKAPWTIDENRTREDEARAVAAAIGARLAAGAEPASIGVAARSLEPYDIALLARFAREHGFSFSTRPALPLIAHRIGRAVVTLLSLRERDFPRGEVLELVRSGLRTLTRINPDKADYETRRAMIAGGRSASLEHRASTSLAIRDYVALVSELEDLTERIDASALSRLVEQFRIENTEDLAAVQALDEIARMFTRAERWNRPVDTRAVIDAIEQITLDPSPAPAGTPAIWLGDVMRLRGRTFAELFAIRMQDDILPQRRTEDPLLPDSDRRVVGIREIGNGREEEALLFELMRGRGVTHFSYASSDGFGKPLRPSQSLKAFAIAEVPGEKTAILKRFSAFAAGARAIPSASAFTDYGRGRDRTRSTRALQLFVRAGTRSPFDGYVTTPLLLERTLAALQSISPTQLEDFGECPQKFLLKHLLGVSDIDNPDREVQINHREKGIVDHQVLERFYRSVPESEIRDSARDLPRLTEVLRDRLEQIIDEEFDKLEEKIPAFNRSMRAMERRATKRVLSSFVAADLADMLERDMMPAHFEYKFGQKHKRRAPDHPEPFIIETGGVPIRVEGTIDRIDIGHGLYRIVDYKSGKALRHEGLGPKIDRGVRLQLPLYAMAVASFFEVPPSAVSGTIKPIARTETSLGKFAFELAETEERLRQTLEIFVNAIISGAFPAFPNETDKEFNSCKYCPVNHSCRTKHDPDERRSALESGDPRTLLEAWA
ncbi:MAG: PD-(D/E)XK nuclease family protein, partial [Thermoanaerobaculia bacterium]